MNSEEYGMDTSEVYATVLKAYRRKLQKRVQEKSLVVFTTNRGVFQYEYFPRPGCCFK